MPVVSGVQDNQGKTIILFYIVSTGPILVFMKICKTL